MDETHAIKSLKRVHDSAVNTEAAGANGVVTEFNDVLSRVKEQYPDNEFIQSVEEVQGVRRPTKMADAVKKVEIRTEQIADALELGKDFKRTTDDDDMPLITIEQSNSQTATQEVSQEVSVEAVMELIELDPQAQQNKEELKGLVEQFENELESDDPDSGTLRQLINDAKEYSTSVAAKLAMLALQSGAIGVLGL